MTTGQGAVEVGAQGVAAVLLLAQGVEVAVHRPGAGGAGTAQGEVTAAQRLTGVDVVQQGGDAGDRGQVQDPAGDGQGADGGDQAAGHGLGVGDAAVDEDDEVAVLAAGQPVLAAERAREPGSQGAERCCLGLGGERLGGEPVDADEGQGEGAGRLALHCPQPPDQGRPVGQAGDRVGERELGQLRVEARGGDARGDVAAIQDERTDVGVGAQVANGGLDQSPAAVGMTDTGGADGDLVGVAAAVQTAGEGGAVVGMDRVDDLRADEAHRVDAEHVGHGLRGEGDVERLVEDQDGIETALDQCAERGLAAVQVAGEAALAQVEGGLDGDRNRQPDQRAHEAEGRAGGQGDPEDGSDGDHESEDGEEPGTPILGRGGVRSRRLPQYGGGGHEVQIGISAP
jgi:hypothetical protein